MPARTVREGQLASQLFRTPTWLTAAAWTSATAGLLPALLISWWATSFPLSLVRFFIGSSGGPLEFAAVCVVPILLASGLVAWLVRVALTWLVGNMEIGILPTLHVLLAAAWVPPLVLFVVMGSVWEAGMAVLLVAGVTTLLRFEWNSARAHGELHMPTGARAPGLLYLSPPSLILRRMAPLFFAVLCAEGALFVSFTRYQLAPAAMLGLSAAVLTWRLQSASPSKKEARPGLLRLLLVTALAVIFTAAGLMQFMPGERRRNESLADRLLYFVFHGDDAKVAEKQTGHPPEAQMVFAAGSGNASGVIVWPESEPRPVMLAPVLPTTTPRLPSLQPADAWSVRFSGEYWFFKPPDERPPERSYKLIGSPLKLALRSADEYQLLMEAHQLFASPVELKCCRQIQVVISNADRHPRTVTVELLVGNHKLPASAAMSLGRAMVTSTQAGDSADPPPVDEVLTFDIPPSAAIREFDEMTIRFHLQYLRSGQSARIAIERLVLVP